MKYSISNLKNSNVVPEFSPKAYESVKRNCGFFSSSFYLSSDQCKPFRTGSNVFGGLTTGRSGLHSLIEPKCYPVPFLQFMNPLSYDDIPRLIPYLPTESISLFQNAASANAASARVIVLNMNISMLESLGTGELTRLALIMSQEKNLQSQLVDIYKSKAQGITSYWERKKIFIEQDSHIESKLQIAFGRAFNSTFIASGAKVLDKLLIDKHVSLQNNTFSYSELNTLAEFIVSTNAHDLRGLSKSELKFIIVKLENIIMSGLAEEVIYHAINIINPILVTAPENLFMRFSKTYHPALILQPNIIYHKTTLFVEVQKKLFEVLNQFEDLQCDLITIKNDLNQIFAKNSYNHESLETLLYYVEKYLTEETTIHSENLCLLQDSICEIESIFHPTINLGLQLESPHARKMENIFASKSLQNPTHLMKHVAKKIIAQIKCQNDYESLIKKYLESRKHYVYPICEKECMQPNDIRESIETGRNIALLIDFHHLVCDHFLQSDYFYTINKGEILHTHHTKTYIEDIAEYRGERIFLPQLSSIKDCQRKIGIGVNDQVQHLPAIKSIINRPVAEKIAYGTHAREAVVADAAQACGPSGRANIHLWGQAIVNQRVPSNLRFTEQETRVFLSMLASVLTADGGHSLSEVLAAAHFASKNACAMQPESREFVNDLFQHTRTITSPMDDLNNKFKHYDMIFSPLADEETLMMLESSWLNTVLESR